MRYTWEVIKILAAGIYSLAFRLTVTLAVIFTIVGIGVVACGGSSKTSASLTEGDATTATVPAAGTCHSDGILPDHSCTPGVINRHVTQSNIHSTICVKGWTSTIRPPVAYTEPLKRRLMQSYGDTQPIYTYELDHLIPLELGGDPASPKNLWPEPHSNGPNPGSYNKDAVENLLREKVCAGMMSLQAARNIMRTDWIRGATG